MKKGFFDKLLLEYSTVVRETSEAKGEEDGKSDDDEEKKGFFSRILSAITSDKKEEADFKKEEVSGGSEKENGLRKNSQDKTENKKRNSIERNEKNRLSTGKSKDRSPSPTTITEKNLSPNSCLQTKAQPKEASKNVIKSNYVEEKLEKLDLKEVSEIKLPQENVKDSRKVRSYLSFSYEKF